MRFLNIIVFLFKINLFQKIKEVKQSMNLINKHIPNNEEDDNEKMMIYRLKKGK